MAIGTLAAFWAVSFLLVLVPGADWAYAIAAQAGPVGPPGGDQILARLCGADGGSHGHVAAVIARSPQLTVLTTFGAVYLSGLGINTVTRPPAPGAAADRASQYLGAPGPRRERVSAA